MGYAEEEVQESQKETGNAHDKHLGFAHSVYLKKCPENPV